jgi:hypothetical protein
MFAILFFLVLLCVTIAFQLKAQHHAGASLEQAITFPLPGVAEALAEKAGIPLADAQRREAEFRRWFAAAAASPVLLGMGSQHVDAFWHTLLERPDLYESYSRAVCRRVVQHIEGIGGDVLDARSWVAYETLWGAPPPADLWPRPADAALHRVRAVRRRATANGEDGMVTLTISDGGADQHAHHHHGGTDGGGHHGHACGGGHSCGGGH